MNPDSAPLVSVYSDAPPNERNAPLELPMWITRPPDGMCRTASCVATNTPVTLTAIIRS